jgi:hypothetical protein
VLSDNNGAPGVDPQLPGSAYLFPVPAAPPVFSAGGNFMITPAIAGFSGMFSANFGFGVSAFLGLTVTDLTGTPGEIDVTFDQLYQGVLPFPQFYLEFLNAFFVEPTGSVGIGNSVGLTGRLGIKV